MVEQGQSARSPLPEEEEVEEATCDEMTTNPMPCPPAPLGRSVVIWPWLATKGHTKETHDHSIASPPAGVGRRKERKR